MDNGASLEEWESAAPAGGEINLAQLDALVVSYKEAEAKYLEQKKISSSLNAEVERIESLIVGVLNAAGKTKYFVDGLGTAYLINRYAVRTPKTNEEKEKFFAYIENKYGKETLISKLGINSQTLQGFYKQEIEALQNEGVADPSIPGIEAPTHEVSLGFRKA